MGTIYSFRAAGIFLVCAVFCGKYMVGTEPALVFGMELRIRRFSANILALEMIKTL